MANAYTVGSRISKASPPAILKKCYNYIAKDIKQKRFNDIVVARIEDEVTVKRLKRGSSRHVVELLPENPDFQPIVVDLREQEFAIEGLSVGVLRRGV